MTAAWAALAAEGLRLQPAPKRSPPTPRSVGAASVADFLARRRPQSAMLTQLTLFNCRIGVAGAAALGRALRFGGNKTLTKLHLDCDSTVGDAGVCDLLRGLETNPSVSGTFVLRTCFAHDPHALTLTPINLTVLYSAHT